uniref:Aldose 1-epimerase n=1 Tax=Phallusia mammillata TaxID=59560 RepID=A0A6F9DCT6_9ASCI|nr:aldose 1-epimerase-like [Phallusia mammillata]
MQSNVLYPPTYKSASLLLLRYYKMSVVTKKEFGKVDGLVYDLYTIKSNQIEVGLINYGAAMAYLKVPDRDGQQDDIVTGFDTLKEYFNERTFFGSIVGRVGNRIGKGKFTVDGKEYVLDTNNGPNNLHGGFKGFDTKYWSGEIGANSVIFRLTSPDGDQGFPGEVNASVTYTVENSELKISYAATSTKSTPINLTHHSFFNLSGHKSWEKDLSKHEIKMCADRYLPADDACLVTGEIKSVENSPFDLRKPTFLTEELLSTCPGGGIDHTFCLVQNKNRHEAAVLKHTTSGRMMTVETTEPGIQLYTGNFLKGQQGKAGVSYTRHSALCLETQNWPDAVNNPATFPNGILKPGEVYKHTAWFTFGTC